MKKILNYINGQLLEPQAGAYLDNINPAKGEVYSLVPNSQAADVEAAYQAAKAAFPTWSKTSVQTRFDILMRIAKGIEARFDEFALAESVDNGKPLWLSKRMDIPRAMENFTYFAQAITQFNSEMHDMGTQGFNYTLRRPIGVVGAISPWNLPLYLFTWKICPALATGNTVVAKPSEVTPMTAYLLSEVCIEAGLPAGVLNIVHGLGPNVGEPIVQHADIPVITFTGSTGVGRRISTIASPMFKKFSLEMGGKNPNVIFADADYETALKGSVRAAFTNQGQICLCGSRILVEKSIYDKFVADFVAETQKMTVGDPLAESSKVGAIVSETQYLKDLSYIELAKEEGGTILCGGKRPENLPEHCQNGYFIEPTVIVGLNQACRVNQEEIFGPIVTIEPFETEEEAVSKANSTTYGLAATVWSSHLQKAHRVAGNIHSGIVWVNNWLVRDLRTPFGGMKHSGVGREGGFDALRFFTEEKNVFIQL
jgi:aminomuconate-semialdehyde/2-hydroxymuconate-6-semialdehyde dehydrogenase